MGVHRTCGEPNEIKKNTHPKYIAALPRGQDRVRERRLQEDADARAALEREAQAKAEVEAEAARRKEDEAEAARLQGRRGDIFFPRRASLATVSTFFFLRGVPGVSS